MRIRKLSRPGLQLKLVGSFLGMTSLALLLQFLLLGGQLTSMLSQIPRHGGDVAQEVPGLLVSVLLLSAAVVLPLMFGLGVVMTHKIAGPVHRFEEYLGQIARGERVGPCRIRKGDELQELCRRLNSAIARLRRDGQTETDTYVSIEGVELDDVEGPVPSEASREAESTKSTRSTKASAEKATASAGSVGSAASGSSDDERDADSGPDHSA